MVRTRLPYPSEFRQQIGTRSFIADMRASVERDMQMWQALEG
jgi:hypothetical protein